MKEVGDRVGERFDQCERTGDADAAGQQVRDSERDGEVQYREAGGFREAQSKWHAHGVLLDRLVTKLSNGRLPVHLIVLIASIVAT
jgi:hypothetical protein